MTIAVRPRASSPRPQDQRGPLRADSPASLRAWWLLVAAAFLGVWVLALDPGGQINSDVAAKIATLEQMKRSGTTAPVLSYWAVEHDPQGKLFAVAGSGLINDEQVAVATLPMLEAALPLYRLGGVRLILLLPILGTLAWAAEAPIVIVMSTSFRIAAQLGRPSRSSLKRAGSTSMIDPSTQ